MKRETNPGKIMVPGKKVTNPNTLCQLVLGGISGNLTSSGVITVKGSRPRSNKHLYQQEAGEAGARNSAPIKERETVVCSDFKKHEKNQETLKVVK